jgi:hypothetical protein
MSEEFKPKVTFAPGCFDNFEGTQEELDEMVAEIMSMFEGKTADEIRAMSNPVTEESFEDLSEEEQMMLYKAFSSLGDTDEDRKNKLN